MKNLYAVYHRTRTEKYQIDMPVCENVEHEICDISYAPIAKNDYFIAAAFLTRDMTEEDKQYHQNRLSEIFTGERQFVHALIENRYVVSAETVDHPMLQIYEIIKVIKES